MDRRIALATLPTFVAGSSGLLFSNVSEAVLPLIFRLFLGGVARGTVTRAITTTVTRSVVTQMVTTASIGLKASGILAVSSAVALAYEKHRATEIWVAGSAEQSLTLSTLQGEATRREQVYLGYQIVDVETGKVEKVGLKNVSIDPDKNISLSHLVKGLPFVGAKFVEGLASFDSKGQRTNDRFQFSERKIVIVADPNEVEART